MKTSPYAFCSAGVSFKRCCSFSRSSLRSIWLFLSTKWDARRSSGSSICSGTCNHGAACQPQGPDVAVQLVKTVVEDGRGVCIMTGCMQGLLNM